MPGLRIPVLLFAACVLAALATACGSSGSPACAVIDSSHSTRYAVSTYLERFEEAVRESADGGGSFAALVATGDPLVESNVETEDFGGLTDTEDASERAGVEQEFVGGVEDEARSASIASGTAEPGSGIVAAISLVAKQDCTSILVLSDGLEAADVRMKVDDILSEEGRRQLLDQVEQQGRLPDLEGIELDFPYGGYLPQGTEISKERLDAVPLFWQAYAERTGSSLSWRS